MKKVNILTIAYKGKQLQVLTKITIIVLMLNLATLNAGSGHGHSHSHSHSKTKVSKKIIKNKANKKLKRLIRKGKIDKSWANIPIKDMKKKQFKNDTQWSIRYENKKIKNKKEQMLYIFISLTGRIKGANYTGK